MAEQVPISPMTKASKQHNHSLFSLCVNMCKMRHASSKPKRKTKFLFCALYQTLQDEDLIVEEDIEMIVRESITTVIGENQWISAKVHKKWNALKTNK